MVFSIKYLRQSLTAEFRWNEFLQIGFTHHMEIVFKANSMDARLFYISECAKNLLQY
ncbi:MAG: hypothetical protein LBG92_05275 [Prevotellaceae bacterium]|nr:hypothetical protein [Prevotellaceae bacterium]